MVQRALSLRRGNTKAFEVDTSAPSPAMSVATAVLAASEPAIRIGSSTLMRLPLSKHHRMRRSDSLKSEGASVGSSSAGSSEAGSVVDEEEKRE